MDKEQSCDECPLNGSPQVPWQLIDNPQYPVLFVGQNPGEIEVITKIPFTGPAGKMCFRLLIEAGLDKRNLSFTNLISCATPDNREPTKQEIECCKERLKGEILFLKPELIIALGAPTTLALTGIDEKIGKIRGNYYPLDQYFEHDCQVLVCYHPSFIMRRREFIDEAVKDFKRIIEFFHPTIEVTSEEPQFSLDPDLTFLERYLNQEKEMTTFDLETTGLNPRKDEVLGISFCNCPDDAVACYLYKGDPRWRVVKDFLTDESKKKCTQNGLFDLSFLDQADIKVEGLSFDTHLAQKMLNPDLPADLNFLRQQFTDIRPYKPSDKEMRKTQFMSKDQLLTMGCWDALTTFRVMREEKKVLSKKEMNLINSLLLPLVPCLNSMERKGILVDVNTLAGLYGQMSPLRDELLKEFEPIGLNPASPVQICKHFGLKNSQEGTLSYLIKRQALHWEWYEKILEFRKYEKSMGTYLKGVFDRLEDGRIHTKFKFGTGTGRLSSEDPNLQNVPEPLRVIYVPDDEDHLFASLDFKQLELRVLGVVAKVQSLLDSLARGEDPHEELRKIIYSEGRETITPFERQRLIAKAALFGTVYGRTKRSLGIEFGVSDETAAGWQQICVYRYPEVLNYWRETERLLSSQGYVETPFGRKRYNLDKRQGYNTPIQGTAGDINNTVLLKLFRKGFDVRLTVHDENVLQVSKKSFKEEVMEAVRLAEEPFAELDGHSFPVKPKVGPNWRDLKKVL